MIQGERRAESGELEEVIGVSCPDCGCEHLPVYYTRRRRGGKIIRVRICRHCGRKVLTTERVA